MRVRVCICTSFRVCVCACVLRDLFAIFHHQQSGGNGNVGQLKLKVNILDKDEQQSLPIVMQLYSVQRDFLFFIFNIIEIFRRFYIYARAAFQERFTQKRKKVANQMEWIPIFLIVFISLIIIIIIIIIIFIILILIIITIEIIILIIGNSNN